MAMDTDELKKLSGCISTGRSVLFTGSGFSKGASNILDEEPVTAKDLSLKICDLGGFEKDDDLRYSSDYYLSKGNKNELINLLKGCYTIKSVDDNHRKIAQQLWRRVYTTNYDNVYERASLECNKIVQPLTIDDSPREYYKQNDTCIHINGYIEYLDEDKLDTSFKLTRSSYVTPDSFSTSQWYYSFKKDLEQCSALIFIGYSLYDIDIEKILFSCPEFKEKTYFVVEKGSKHKELFSLSKYGHVLDISLDGFVEIIVNINPNERCGEGKEWLEAFEQYEITENDSRITDNEIIRFILSGEIRNSRIDDAISSYQKKKYLIIREKNSEIVNRLLKGDNVVLCGEFGCGKSIAARQLVSSLAMYGKKVYILSDIDGDHIRDIEKINISSTGSVLVIDDYAHSIDTIKYICQLNSDRIQLLLIDRTYEHEKSKFIFTQNNYELIEYNLDALSDDEVYQLVDVIDNLGYWGEKAYYSVERKADLLATKCNRHLSVALLQIFESPNIKDKIREILDPLMDKAEYKRTIFAICLIELLNFPSKLSLISEMACNDEVYKISLKDHPSFVQLYRRNVYGQLQSKSSLLSLNILQNHFNPSYIIETLLEIVEKYERNRYAGQLEEELFKNLLRFSYIERILPEKNKKNSMVKYYEELKVRVSWLKNDPHYWLQYGMARIMFKEYNDAQKYFDQAYNLADHRKNYHTGDIDTQQARLYLLKSLDESVAERVFEYFKKADALLSKQHNDIYKFRQVMLYGKFYNQKYTYLGKTQKEQFVLACKRMKWSMERDVDLWLTKTYGDSVQDKCFKQLSKIIAE